MLQLTLYFLTHEALKLTIVISEVPMSVIFCLKEAGEGQLKLICGGWDKEKE